MTEPAVTTIDAYISQFSPEIQEKLCLLRETIRTAAPAATERISWQMPTFYLAGNLIHFAVHKHHIGLYPGPDAIVAFQEQIAGYTSSKGAIQLPLDQPLPVALVQDIVRYRVKVNLDQAESKLTKHELIKKAGVKKAGGKRAVETKTDEIREHL